MNPCVAILERAIEKAAAISAEDRAVVYDRARKSLGRHFSAARTPIADIDYDLVTRNLEEAIAIIEAGSSLDNRSERIKFDAAQDRVRTSPGAQIMTIRPRATF